MSVNLDFDIADIYTLVHKTEKSDFVFSNFGRAWDGFVLVTDGQMTFCGADKREQTVKKGGMVFLYKNEKYTFKSKGDCAYYTSAFDLKSAKTFSSSLLPKIVYCSPVQIAKVCEATKIWQEQLAESFMFCKVEFLKLYLDFLKSNPENQIYSKDLAINTAIKYIHENFKRNFKTQEIAKACLISESHLRLKFLRETGKTITQYRDELRLKAAKELLLSGFFTVKQTAFELGFCDVYYFTKFFSTFTNTTPSKFIKENPKNKN